ncbi:hypothetical protein J6590_022267 [Homalodisca vitripennis]|nr:hypothetical protein J6590_022267 [Homalodisca vitripennis]
MTLTAAKTPPSPSSPSHSGTPFPYLTATKLLHSITTELIANLLYRVQLVRRVESVSVNKEATDNDLHSVAAKSPHPPPPVAQATPAPPPPTILPPNHLYFVPD